MKKIFTIIALLAFAAQGISQEQVKNQDYYLGKSKKQKGTAYALLIGGTAGIGIGFLIGNRKNSSFGEAGTGVIIGGLGLLSILGSIPLFAASGKNKRKANLMISSADIHFNPLLRSGKRLLNIGIAVPL